MREEKSGVVTMSKTLEKLIVMVNMRCGDKGCLKPRAILCAIEMNKYWAKDTRSKFS